MLDSLRSIIQEVGAAATLSEALKVAVARVRADTGADVCSIYLGDEERSELVLLATEGLKSEAVGSVRLSWEQGLVGLVAQRAEPLNLGDAPSHPRYLYFPETGEEQYHAFLGVPVIHHRRVLGVLVIQQHALEPYSEDIVTLLLTIAAQLAGVLSHADVDSALKAVDETSAEGERLYRGQPGAPGVAVGTAVVMRPPADIGSVPERSSDRPDLELKRFDKAVQLARVEIGEMMERLSESMPSADRALFDAYLMMLDSGSFIGAARSIISDESQWAPGALSRVVRQHARAFEAMDDPYLRERAEDVRDLGRRILGHLEQQRPKRRSFPKETVLIGEEISASMLAEVPPERLAGVVTIRGSRTSHTAILARALGIPAVMGAEEMSLGRLDDGRIIADGYSGRVYIEPGREVLREYRRLQKEEAELTGDLLGLREQPCESTDGVAVPLHANTGLLSDIGPSLNSGAEGVGLYRTEFPFMIRESFPGEASQADIYRQVLEAFAPRPVTMRTLDVGGDKALPYFPIVEDNPFLGWRGIRITLDHPEIFIGQIRAMLKADAGLGNLQLLLPMISSLDEVEESQALIRRACMELEEEGMACLMPRVGAMIEVPSAVFQARELAQRMDFLSIGSNDLTQYLLAVDRNNARVADLYDALHPAVLRAVYHVVEAGRAEGKPVSVCGEMAGDPAAAILLLGMGIDSLSMSASSLLRIKWVIRSFSQKAAAELLEEALSLENSTQVRMMLNGALEEAGLGGLVRAGR